MRSALVIGYGNPLRGDDAFGWHAAHRLVEWADHELIQVLAVHQLTPELAEPVSKAERVIFIDASHQGEPGTWKCEEIRPEVGLANSLAHHFTPASLLACASIIFNVSPRAQLIAFSARSFDCGEALTPRAKAALAEVLQHVWEQVLPSSRILSCFLCIVSLYVVGIYQLLARRAGGLRHRWANGFCPGGTAR